MQIDEVLISHWIPYTCESSPEYRIVGKLKINFVHTVLMILKCKLMVLGGFGKKGWFIFGYIW